MSRAYELVLLCARRILSNVQAGRRYEPATVEWAETEIMRYEQQQRAFMRLDQEARDMPDPELQAWLDEMREPKPGNGGTEER